MERTRTYIKETISCHIENSGLSNMTIAAKVSSHGRMVGSWRNKKRVFRHQYWPRFKETFGFINKRTGEICHKHRALDKNIHAYEDHLKTLFEKKYLDIERQIRFLLRKKATFPYFGHSFDDVLQEALIFAWKRFDDYESKEFALGTYLGYISGSVLTKLRLKRESRTALYTQKQWDNKKTGDVKSLHSEDRYKKKTKSGRPVASTLSTSNEIYKIGADTIADKIPHEEDSCFEERLDLKIMLEEARGYILSNNILSKREIHIIIKRFFEGRTLEDTAESVKKIEGRKITRERIRQLQDKGLEKIQVALKDHESLRALERFV